MYRVISRPLIQLCLDYCSFVVKSEVGKCEFSKFVLFLPRDCFLYSGLLVIPCEFENQYFSFYGKACWNFDRDCVESVDFFEWY